VAEGESVWKGIEIGIYTEHLEINSSH